MLLRRVEHRGQYMKLMAIDYTALKGTTQQDTDAAVPYLMRAFEYYLGHPILLWREGPP